ncbi:MAG: TonB family protein [Bacteroidota bacterium]
MCTKCYAPYISVNHADLGGCYVSVNDYGNRYNLRLRKINTVVGVVKSVDGEPLPGATVLIPENNQGTMTDMDGRFQLDVQSGQSLTFSYLGYTSVHHNVGKNKNLEVQLAPDQVQLDEVVVSGTGIRKNRSTEGVASQVIPNQLNAMPADRIVGKVAGVNVGRGRARKKNKQAAPRRNRNGNNVPVPAQAVPMEEIAVLDNERDREEIDMAMDIPEPMPDIAPEPVEAVPPPPPVLLEEKKELAPQNGPIVSNEEFADDFKDKNIEDEEFFDGDTIEELPALPEEEPEMNAFVFADQQPGLINIQEVRQQIGYPTVAKNAGIEGTVVMRVLVDKEGNYKRHRVISSPHPLLGKQVEKQIHNLRFTPALQGNTPMDFWVNIPFKFDLNEQVPWTQMPANQVVNRSGNGKRATAYYRAREFSAPNYKGQSVPATRNDFRSTIYWNGHVSVGRNGKAKVKFYTSDALTSFNVTAEGIGVDGSIGHSEHKFFSQLPFALSTKIPTSLVQFDTLMLPITLANNTTEPQYGQMSYAIPDGLIPLKKLPARIDLPTGKALTLFVPFLVNAAKGIGKLRIGFKSRGLSDGVEEEVKFAPKGFPSSVAFSSEEPTASFDADLTHAVHGSMNISLTAFPDVSGEILSGLEGMLREPYGCFEQTSSSTYPNLLILDYLESTEQDKPEIRKRAHSLIQKGYNRLITFESSGGGFEWFGGNPAHEGLTAYGLMEFVDMKKVYSGVDQNMIDRTAKWLLSRRDGNGGFMRNPRALHQFGLADQATMSLYITWALTEAGYSGLEKELDYAYEMSRKSRNPYQLGLAANALFNYGMNDKAMACLQVLELKRSEATGQFPYQTTGRSAPGSGGLALGIETSSLILLAMMKEDNPNRQQINELAKSIRNSRNAYGAFGSTNSTVLALRALIQHAAFAKQTETSGVIEVLADGHPILEQSYEAGRTEPIIIRGLEQGLDAGPHRFEVRFNGVRQPLPYVLAINWYSNLPHSQETCSVDLETNLRQAAIKQGETVRLTAQLRNKTTGGLPMTMAILGIPAGLSPQPWQLKEMKEKGILDFYEVLDNELVCYFRQMTPSEEKVLNFDLKADLPGVYAAPASRAYLYYTDEFKTWTQPLEIAVSD